MESGSVNPMVLKKRLARDIVEQFHNKQAAGDAAQHFEKTVQKREVPEEITEYQVSFASLVEALGPAVRFSEFVSGDAEQDIGKHVKSVLLPSVPFASLIALSRVTDTRAEAKRLLAQSAVEVDGKKITVHSAVEIHNGSIIKVGKRRFVKIVDADKQT
jgi:tyrosyl-tRNA synthetase